MAIFLNRQGENYLLGVWKMEESISELLSLLPEKAYYEQAIAQFKTPHRIQEWLSVRVLLNHLIGEHHIVQYHPDGKPFIIDDEWYLSISHTKGYVAVIVSKTVSVGIDIEYYAQRIHKVSAKFLRDDEVINIFNGDSTWSLLLHWSAKETMFKSINDIEIDFKHHLHILPFLVQEEGMFETREYKTNRLQIFEMNYLLDSEFVLTWQVDKK